MKKLFGLVLLIMISLCGFAASVEPVFVMLEQDPWAMVMGSDSPRFVLYSDGTVIFSKKTTDRKCTYYSCKVESAEQLLSELTPESKHSLSNNYSLLAKTDQPITLFFWKDKHIRVYGKIQNQADKPNETSEDAAKCPPEIVGIVQRIKNFDPPAAKKWLPEKIEVMVWPYEHALEESIIWPTKWPNLTDVSTKKRGKDSYSIYIPSTDHDEIVAFLATRNRKGAVLISDQKMSASIRFPFPSEKVWMKRPMSPLGSITD